MVVLIFKSTSSTTRMGVSGAETFMIVIENSINFKQDMFNKRLIIDYINFLMISIDLKEMEKD